MLTAAIPGMRVRVIKCRRPWFPPGTTGEICDPATDQWGRVLVDVGGALKAIPASMLKEVPAHGHGDTED